VLVSACTPKDTGRPKVVVSVFPIFDLARRVAGPDADVTLLLPPSESASPSPGGAAHANDVAGAKLGVMVGLDLDAWMEPLLQANAPKARVLKVGDRVPTLTTESGAIDPHVWLDPQRARLIVKAIGEDMARVDARHANAYRARANDVDASLEALDKELEQRTAAWKNKAFVTREAAFAYFAERYKLTITATPNPQTHVALALALLTIGGTPETDTYEKLLRYDVAQLEKSQLSAPSAPEATRPPSTTRDH